MFRKFLRDESAATAIEYSLIAGFIALAMAVDDRRKRGGIAIGCDGRLSGPELKAALSSGSACGAGHRIGPALSPDGRFHASVVGSPDSPGFCQYVCQPRSIFSLSATVADDPGTSAVFAATIVRFRSEHGPITDAAALTRIVRPHVAIVTTIALNWTRLSSLRQTMDATDVVVR